jgi:hypothetical protein
MSLPEAQKSKPFAGFSLIPQQQTKIAFRSLTYPIFPATRVDHKSFHGGVLALRISTALW